MRRIKLHADAVRHAVGLNRVNHRGLWLEVFGKLDGVDHGGALNHAVDDLHFGHTVMAVHDSVAVHRDQLAAETSCTADDTMRENAFGERQRGRVLTKTQQTNTNNENC